MTTPAVSVIIPMFNASQFVGQCLESLLAQTFQDFEVIVVDDCSTDSSCAVVESYAPKFNGRLKLIHTEKNSGGCAVPRNVGFKFARGEYVFHADADDLLTLTALEELYTLAKDYDADVVYCEKHYEATHDLSGIYLKTNPDYSYVTTPTLDTEDFATRVRIILDGHYIAMAWTKMVRRKLLAEHNLSFPPCKVSEDDVWTYSVLFRAKRFLRVPNIVYVWRQSKQSILRHERSAEEILTFWLNPIIVALKMLEENLCKLEFFRQNPQYCCAILEDFVHNRLHLISKAASRLSTAEIYTLLKETFGKNLGDRDVLVSWLLTDLIMQQKVFIADQQKIDELTRKLEEKLS